MNIVELISALKGVEFDLLDLGIAAKDITVKIPASGSYEEVCVVSFRNGIVLIDS